MADENNPAGYKADAGQTNQEGAKDGIPESKPGAVKQPDSEDNGNDSHASPKPSVLIRLWHALWRKRVFLHRSGGGPHWAEISVVILTLGILVVGAIQAYIYWKQAQVMQNSLEQNQQSIALNMGQVAIAERNAKTAVDTLNEIQEGGNDTHELAVQAGKQAERAKEIAERTLAQATATNTLAQETERSAKAAEGAVATAQKSLEFQQRPWITFGFNFDHDVTEGPIVILGAVKNVGNGPALSTTTTVEATAQICGGPNGAFPPNPPYPVATWPSAAILMPNVPQRTQPHPFVIDGFTLSLLNGNICTFYIYATTQFCDVFHRGHYQHFCGKWVAGTPHEIIACDTYNDGDQDYPDKPPLACILPKTHGPAIIMPEIPPDILNPEKK